MKHLIFLFLLSCSVLNYVSAKPLLHDTSAPVYEHLIEVNDLWKDIGCKELNLNEKVAFENDVDRIQLHLTLVHQLLSEKNTSHLNSQQLAKRQHHLNVLKSYFSQSQFPINTYHKNRQPYFIDKFGTACAVGYLLLSDGQDEFVQKIVGDNNYAYVMEMEYAELDDWATKNGFTNEELALIQPTYGPSNYDFRSVGKNLGVDGKINKLLTSENGELMYMCGDFDAVDCLEGYNSIAAWDGEEWLQLGDGVAGEIMDMMEDYLGNLYVVGNFTDPNDASFSNIAIWEDDEWTFLQQGEMNGSIHTIYAYHTSNIYIGGDFTMLNNEPISYIAKSDGDNNVWQDIDGKLTINGPVYEIEKIGDYYLFGGDFSQTYPNGSDPNVPQLTVNNLVYWNTSTWLTGFNEPDIGVITSIDYFDGKLYVGGPCDDGVYYSVLEIGIWHHLNEPNVDMIPLGDNFEIEGCIEYNGRTKMYGGFAGANFGSGLLDVTNVSWPSWNAEFEGGSVTAAAVFNGEIYFAGGFNRVSLEGDSDEIFNNIVVTTFSAPSSVEPIETNSFLKVCYSNEKLRVHYGAINQDVMLTIFSLSGQAIHEVKLEPGSNTLSVDLGGLPKGAYVVSTHNKDVINSEMIAVY